MDGEGEFQGTERFEVVRRLGSGGMGVVYEVLDNETGEHVALKTLHQTGPDELYRFKREFRSLANVLHPGLVTLYELLTSGSQWFFTMELVHGVPLLQYVQYKQPATDLTVPDRPPLAALSQEPTTHEPVRDAPQPEQTLPDALLPEETLSDELLPEDTRSMESQPVKTVSGVVPTGPVSLTVPTVRDGVAPVMEPLPDVSRRVHLGRLRFALLGLAQGVAGLHAAGRLHRDIKPSNVLVTDHGRVVMLDFGLVTELRPRRPEVEETVSGTFLYMAPEQIKREQADEASDWYAVGVLLYELLTGEFPFSGTVPEVLFAKCSRHPRPVDALVSGCPADLSELCMSMLEMDPRRRPTGEQVLRGLGQVAASEALTPTGQYTPTSTLVGRDEELARLRRCLDEVRAGRSATVHVEGEPGMGKSALVQAFLEQALQEEAVVLAGQCFEREAVPFKALDALMDSLCRHLCELPSKQARAMVPDGAAALARLFPVLARVPGMAHKDSDGAPAPEPLEVRRQAFLGARELLRRLAARATLVLHVDNAQWGDADSGRLLVELLRPPDPPTMLLVVTCRAEQPSPLLKELARAEATSEASFLPRASRVRVGPLGAGARLELARLCLARCDGDAERAEAIAAESGGDPFLLGELARFPEASATSVESVVQARIRDLPSRARRFLELVTVAARPVGQRLVSGLAGLGAGERATVDLLRSRQMLTVTGVGEQARLDVSHNRFREVLLASIRSDDLAALHMELAHGLKDHGGEPQELMFHFSQAGRPDMALVHGRSAAAAAERALAFDRAAAIYRDLLRMTPEDDPDRLGPQVRLAEALANAGRGNEAARAFAEAASQCSDYEALDLIRRCAEQFLNSGRVDEGREALERALAAVGMRLAGSPNRALLSYLKHTFQLRLRGTSFEPRSEREVPQNLLARLDTAWTAAQGLALVDTIRGADFHKRALLLALEAGEPERVARSLAMEVGFAAALGQGNAHRLMQELEQMAGNVESPRIRGLMLSAHAAAVFQEGAFARCLELAERAERIYRRCTGVAWELGKTHVYQIASLGWLGRVDQYCRRLPELLEDARARADLHTYVNMRLAPSLSPGLVLDEVDTARQEVEDAIDAWSHGGFHLQHYYAAWKRAQVALYAGAPQEALGQMERVWPKLRRALFLRMPLIRVHATEIRGRAALACAFGASGAQPLREAAGHARRLKREGLAWSGALAALLRAGVTWCNGDEQKATARYDEAAGACEAAGMGLHAAAARHRAAGLRGEAGEQQAEAAEEWMRRQWIKNPEAMVRMLAPGPVTG